MREAHDRINFMDSMRSILMMLGIVLHSAQVYNPKKAWVIYDDKSSEIFQYLIEYITSFRMPAFFVISGFFSIMMLKKLQTVEFLTSRIRRILVPLVSTGLIINSLQAYILHESGWVNYDLSSYVLAGKWIAHLWFLINLFVYVMLLVLCIRISKFRECFTYLSELRLSFLIVLFPVIPIIVKSFNLIGVDIYIKFIGLFSVWSLLKYLPFFLFGVIIYHNRAHLMSFSNANPIILILIILGLSLLTKSLGAIPQIILETINTYTVFLISMLATSVCFYIFHKYFNIRSTIWRYLSEASYSIYLFHQIIVILLGLLMRYLNLPVPIKFLLLVGCTLIITLAIHEYFIVRFPHMRLMFNGYVDK